MNQYLTLKCVFFFHNKTCQIIASHFSRYMCSEYEQSFDHLIQQVGVPPLKQLIAVNSPAWADSSGTLIRHSPNTSTRRLHTRLGAPRMQPRHY